MQKNQQGNFNPNVFERLALKKILIVIAILLLSYSFSFADIIMPYNRPIQKEESVEKKPSKIKLFGKKIVSLFVFNKNKKSGFIFAESPAFADIVRTPELPHSDPFSRIKKIEDNEDYTDISSSSNERKNIGIISACLSVLIVFAAVLLLKRNKD